jgi:glyoxylase-like metal-dependent hydrolase (beta-lactamase superfamily II)
MRDYLAQLKRVQAMKFETIWPTHGPQITEPQPFLDAYIAHRENREAQVLAQLQNGQDTIKAMVAVMYADVDKRLHPAAAHSVLAHMIHLVEQGKALCEGAPGLDTRYSLA